LGDLIGQILGSRLKAAVELLHAVENKMQALAASE